MFDEMTNHDHVNKETFYFNSTYVIFIMHVKRTLLFHSNVH